MVIDDAVFHTVIENLQDGVYFVDTNRVIQFWSAGAERITGYALEEVRGHSCSENILVHVDEAGRSMCQGMCPLARTMQHGKPEAARVYLKHKDGHRVPVQVFVAPIRDDLGVIIGGLETFHDASNPPYSIQELEQLKQTLYLCALTGIPNRRYIEETMPVKFEEIRRSGKHVAIMVIDIDHFKRFNDTYGHPTGDLILKMVARTLAHAMRTYDMLGRWGGEEFIAIMVMERPSELLAIADRMRVLVETSSKMISRNKLAVTVSIGAVGADASSSWQETLQLADQRMYQSKKSGRNRVTVK